MCFFLFWLFCRLKKGLTEHTHTHSAFIGADKAHSQPAGCTTATVTLMKHLFTHISRSTCVRFCCSWCVCVCGVTILKSKVKAFFYLYAAPTYSLSGNPPISMAHGPLSFSSLSLIWPFALSISLPSVSLSHLCGFPCAPDHRTATSLDIYPLFLPLLLLSLSSSSVSLSFSFAPPLLSRSIRPPLPPLVSKRCVNPGYPDRLFMPHTRHAMSTRACVVFNSTANWKPPHKFTNLFFYYYF